VGLVTASLIFHGAILFSLDRTTYFSELRALRQEQIQRQKSAIQFEFVEAPPKANPQVPVKTKKISDRDAVNQDLLKDKSRAAVSPQTKANGIADQLAQKRGKPAQAPMPMVEPAKTQKPQEELQKPEKQTPTKDLGMKPLTPEAKQEVKVQPVQPKPAVEPKPEVKGQPGQDKITTQEMAKAKSPGAQLFGLTSFEATGSGMGEYMKNLKERIWLAWFPYLAFKYPGGFTGADAVISITINAKGEVKILKLLVSEGDPFFATFCMEAVQRASGFGPLPKEILALIGKDELELKFGFHYR
jgi:outer membrane biosynthesis protein TonB